MNSFKKIASALLLGSVFAGSAQAQISNTVYFQKYNFRTHYVNPSAVPETRFYMGTPVPFVPVPFLGTISAGAGNNSFCFADIIKNVEKNGKKQSVLCLDSSVPNGQEEFLDQIRNTWCINSEAKVSFLDFGFRAKEKNFFSFSVNANMQANTYIPKEFFSVLLDGMDYHNDYDMNINKLGLNANIFFDFSMGYTRLVNEKLNVGGAIKLLKGFGSIKTKTKDLLMTTGADEWVMSGEADIYVSYPGVTAVNEDGKFSKLLGDGDNYSNRELLKGNLGLGLDLGATYQLLPKLSLSASVIDLGFIRYNNFANKIHMQQDFKFDGADLDLKTQDIDFSNLSDSFEDAFIGESDIKYTQFLNAKVYMGAEYEVNKWFSAAALSKTTFHSGHVSEELSLQGQIHPIRLLSLALAYNIYDHQWSSVSTGASINLGPFNIFAAIDNLPLRTAKVNDEYIVPNHMQYVRLNVGFGFTIGPKKKKNLDDAGMMAEEAPEDDFFDADGDGVQDADDKCADTPFGVIVDANGCPEDADKDGVPDYLDKCPSTPEGVEVDENGCPVDADKDGVPDYQDACPDTPEGMPVDHKGCPIDDDHDGVTDALDKCPDTPSGVTVDVNGCPVDTDGDGVPDYLDKCPDVKGVASNNGCPEVKKEVKQLLRKALNGIQFQSGSSTILRTSYTILDQIANTMIMNPDYKLYIAGHTDNVGNPDQNLKLSKDRANSVVQYLVKKGVEESRLSSDGFGDTMPVVPNNSSANRAKNRRVEFEVEF